jgi:hypothetical protein
VKKLKKRITAWFAVLVMMLVVTAPALALDDDEYNGYAADTLSIQVGYYGGPYYEKHVFTLDELWKLNVVHQDYTFIDNMPSVVIDHVAGVRLADLMDAAGIDLNSVQTFYFWTRDKQSNYYTSYAKTSLIDTPRYCYYSLPDNFDEETGEGNSYATSDGTEVDTVIALADDWNRCIAGATFGSDYLNLNTNTRFRLIFGQTNSYEHTASRSAKWIHKIVVELGGAPTLTLDASVLKGKVGSVLRTEASVSADSTVKAHEKIQWSSSDESVATVDENGNITVHKEGKAVITATFGGVSASVTVNGVPGESQKQPAAAATGTGIGTGSGTGNGTGTGSGTGNGTGSGKTTSGSTGKTGTSSAATKPLTESAKPTEIQLAPSGTATAGNTAGGVQNWRTYEMSPTATELGNVETDRSLLGAVGASLGGIFVASGTVYAAVFYMETRGKKHAHNHKSH